ncbi:sigma-70 family RNA polymerase sigma factor [Acetobacter sp. DmW_136]|uniref:RNA polymerase sigma factor n=1 Tax=Acetobacter sp. DmW_136 TaxID=2591091 RepID=UPI0007E62242|nr:sigma-70 family RNA polymerase sigma factor [Acetobacter sp. DmW_136]KAA8386424.1 sigma-70 family RNA polymerase sigma factor [Acetobacter sp. DmW_136]
MRAGAWEGYGSLEQKGSLLVLYSAHRRDLLKYANGLVADHSVAEDIVQEAWLRLDRGAEAATVSEPLRYLYRIIRNLALDLRRKGTRERAVFTLSGVDSVIEQQADAQPGPEQIAQDKAQLEAIQAVLAALPERTRIAFEMHRFGGCKLREIAAHLNISTPMAHVLVSEAVDACKQQVDWP